MSDGLRDSPLYEAHVSAGARMVDFAGWRMPMMYRGILQEHRVVRESAGIFDVSHMGRLLITGDYAFKLLAHACTAEVVRQEDDTASYGMLCNDRGGVIDDVMVYRLPEAWWIVCNASNREKVLSHLQRLNEQGGFGAVVADRTEATAMVAVQGPVAVERLAAVLPLNVTGLPRRGVRSGELLGAHYIVSRTGYTGEDGLEVILPAALGSRAWAFVTSEKAGVQPAGLGARDVLRVEAGLPLYGHELNETIDPITAGLERFVRPGDSFVGGAALAGIRQAGPARRRIGLRLEGRRIARHGAVVWADGKEVGVVTSGTWSPACEASVAMAFVDRPLAAPTTELHVEIRGEERAVGVVVNLPFYRGSAWSGRG